MQRRSVAFLLLAGLAVAVGVAQWFDRRSVTSEPTNEPIDHDSIVLIGDSITAEGRWSTVLPAWPAVNRGRAGFTTRQLVSVAGEVASARPRIVVVLTGTNDIRDSRSAAWTAEHLAALLDQLESGSPSTQIVVQTILPRSDASDAVRRANEVIRGLVDERGLRLLDLHAVFDDGAGGLRAAETYDGVHLTPVGYERWAAALEPVLAELAQS